MGTPGRGGSGQASSRADVVTRLEAPGRLASGPQPGPDPRAIVLEPYRGTWPSNDPDAGFRQMVAEYSRIDPLPTLETLSRNKGIPVGALAAFVLARYCCSGSEALLALGPLVVRQMAEVLRRAEAAGTDAARLDAYRALAAIVSWLNVPLDETSWRPGPSPGGPTGDGPDRAAPARRHGGR